jgi:hypothetical protein
MTKDEAEKMVDAFGFEAATKARVVEVGYVPSIKACEPGYNQARAALIAALIAPPGVPDGWKLVPIAPTEAMGDAGHDTGCTSGDGTIDEWISGTPEEIWKAMLAAAPPAPVASVADAVAAEREACAKVCEGLKAELCARDEAGGVPLSKINTRFAAAIRARGQGGAR